MNAEKVIWTVSGVAVAVIVLLGIFIFISATSPHCTTFVDQGYKLCNKAEWGGQRYWSEPLDNSDLTR